MKLLSATIAAPLLAVSFGDCSDGISREWQRFNATDDLLVVEVTDSDASLVQAVADITSSTGETIIGEIRVSPGSGPIGTEHRVVVSVGATWEDEVGRVDLEIETADRGSRVMSMEQDSADAGTWVLDIRSYGVEGEVRADSFRARLYELVEVVEAEDPTTTSAGADATAAARLVGEALVDAPWGRR